VWQQQELLLLQVATVMAVSAHITTEHESFSRTIVFAIWRQYVPPPKTWFHGPMQVNIPNGIGSAIFVGLIRVTKTQMTDRPGCVKTCLRIAISMFLHAIRVDKNMVDICTRCI